MCLGSKADIGVDWFCIGHKKIYVVHSGREVGKDGELVGRVFAREERFD